MYDIYRPMFMPTHRTFEKDLTDPIREGSQKKWSKYGL